MLDQVSLLIVTTDMRMTHISRILIKENLIQYSVGILTGRVKVLFLVTCNFGGLVAGSTVYLYFLVLVTATRW